MMMMMMMMMIMIMMTVMHFVRLYERSNKRR